jgi:hypothetical protein
VVEEVCEELGVSFEEVDITGDPELEARYREWLPVVEIDGARAFVYHVPADGLRRRLTRDRTATGREGPLAQ